MDEHVPHGMPRHVQEIFLFYRTWTELGLTGLSPIRLGNINKSLTVPWTFDVAALAFIITLRPGVHRLRSNAHGNAATTAAPSLPRKPDPHRARTALSGRQLLGVARSGLRNPGAGLTAGGVDDRDDISRLVIAHAPHARPLLPIGAIRVALDLPFAMEHGPGRRLV